MQWGKYNHVEFDNKKDEEIAFMRRRKSELKKRIAKVRITVCRQIMKIHTEAIRSLGVYLDT